MRESKWIANATDTNTNKNTTNTNTNSNTNTNTNTNTNLCNITIINPDKNKATKHSLILTDPGPPFLKVWKT